MKPYKEAIAILKLSTLYGLGDPRFVATFGGMLYLDKQFAEADKIFQESLDRDFTWGEKNEVQFYPPDPKDAATPLRENGKIVVVKAAYSLIESGGYPRLLCPASKYDGLVMRPDMQISFQIVFSAKDCIAIRPQLCNNDALVKSHFP